GASGVYGTDNAPQHGENNEDPTPIGPSEPHAVTAWHPRNPRPRLRPGKGKRLGASGTGLRGVFVRDRVPESRCRDPALDAALGAAAPWQSARGRSGGGSLIVHPADLREKVRRPPSRHLIVFAVDASRSMGARRRMAATKAMVLSLLVDAYQKRDQVGL